MAFLFGCENVHLEFPTKTIFDSLSLGVDDGDCIGIVGRNGDGKSSLLGLFDGTVLPDDGRVLRSRGVRFASLAQKDALDDEKSVGWNVVGDVPEYQWASDATVRSILDGLISDIDWNTPTGSLSGGERRRVDLARVLIADADVLLLDEPTNHLDVAAIAWLAQHLKQRFKKRSGALLVVTHDRWFLDEVCLSMWEVHDRLVEPFEGGYSAYILQRVERQRVAEQAERKRQNLLRRELSWLSRGARARSTKPKFHVETARALIAQEPPLRNTVELKRAAISRLGKQCVTLEDVSFSYPEVDERIPETEEEALARISDELFAEFDEGAVPHPGELIIDNVTWPIGPGDRFGLLGENGAGKSTLLEIVQGHFIPQKGSVKIGKTVKFAYLSQKLEELEEFANDRVRVVLGRYQSRYVVDGKVVSPAILFEQLGFESSYLNAPVNTLSGGQKRRLQLMLILLDAPNVLILDEPSNDLDTDMMVAMENVLDTWPGTLIVVSHDRYLMERVTDYQYALIDGKLRHVPRGVEEYLELLEESKRKHAAQKPSFASEAPKKESAASTNGAPALSGGEAREARKRLKSLERKMSTATNKIEDKKAEQLAADPTDYEKLGLLQQEIANLQEALEELELEWLEVSELLGE